MKVKKVIPAFLILFMVLQLLPVKQAVRYFFIDNLLVEEILDVDKNATKNCRLLDEDHNLPDIDYLLRLYVLVNKLLAYHFAEMLPPVQALEIHTPPPNNCFI